MKLIAEWFITDRWMGGSGFLLPMEARGLYREMLTQAWRRGARLPNDHEAIRRAIGASPEEWKRCWDKVKKYWREDGEWLVNDTQLEIYADAHDRAVRAHERGKKGAQASAQARAQAPTQAQPKSAHKTNPPSPSPSPTETTDSNDDEKQTLSPSATPELVLAVVERPGADLVRNVFDYWRIVFGTPKSKLDDKRRKAISGSLKLGYTVHELCQAIDGCSRSSFHAGLNDRGEKYHDIELICRDAKRVERFIEIAKNGEAAPLSPTTVHNARALGLTEFTGAALLQPLAAGPALTKGDS